MADISGAYPHCEKLGADLFFGLDGELGCEAKEGMPGRMISALVNARGLAGVYDDDAFFVIDDPGVDGEPFRPGIVEEHVRQADVACAVRLHLRAFHFDQAGADCMNLWHVVHNSCSL